jgi:hypothetical protein
VTDGLALLSRFHDEQDAPVSFTGQHVVKQRKFVFTVYEIGEDITRHS